MKHCIKLLLAVTLVLGGQALYLMLEIACLSGILAPGVLVPGALGLGATLLGMVIMRLG